MKRIAFFLSILILLASLPLAAAAKDVYQEVIPLEQGLVPEGITEGTGNTFYYGTINGGAIFRGDYRTGEIEEVVAPDPSKFATGIDFDQRTGLLYVASAFLGQGYVYDVVDGSQVASLSLAAPFTSLINDVTISRDAVYFTDSFQPHIYKIALGEGGALPDTPQIETIVISGDFVNIPQPPPPAPFLVNANGIVVTPNDEWLIVVHSELGKLYRVDPVSGDATEIDLGGSNVDFGDGLVLRGHTLYVVQNYINMIGVVELDPGYASGSYIEALTSDAFRVPTTAAIFGNALYAVNARFDEFDPTNPPPDAEFEAVRVELN